MGTLKTTNIQTITGSGTLTLGTSGETLTVPTGVTTTLTDGVSGDLKFNSGYGSVATAYGVRAWVQFKGSGTLTVNASGNITSITDNGTGNYTLNFTNNMPDTNYCYTTTACNPSGTRATMSTGSAKTVSTLNLNPVSYTGAVAQVDLSDCNVTVFR